MKRIERLWCMVIAMLLVLAFQDADAQVKARVEYPADDEHGDMLMLPIEKQGAAAVYIPKHDRNNEQDFVIDFYDTNLKLKKTEKVKVSPRVDFYRRIYKDGVQYIILTEKRGGCDVVKFDTRTAKANVVKAQNDQKKWTIFHPLVAEGKMVFGSEIGEGRNAEEHVGMINLTTGESRFVKVKPEKVRNRDFDLKDFAVIDHVIYALMSIKNDIYLKRIDMDGNVLETICVAKDNQERLLSASISKAGNGYFMTGTYTTDQKAGRSQGIYIAKLGKEGLDFIKFYNYLELNNFTEYMSDRKKAKVERRKAKAEKHDKVLNVNLLMTSHNIMEHNGAYYYVGEAYEPVYRTVRSGQMVTSEFVGYEYSHAIIVKFDKQGEKVWDSCFPMHPSRRPYYVKQFVSVGFQNNQVNAIYGDRKMLVSKFFGDADGSVLKERTKEVLDTDNEDEDVKKASYTDIEHWYDNNFMVYGYQVVKNKTNGDRRRVFYINKYSID